MADILLIEGCNFDDYPVGGQLSFSKQMMHIFGNRLALVGVCTDNTPSGVWIEKQFAGNKHPFLGVGYRNKMVRKPLVPGRLFVFWKLRRFKEIILSMGVLNVFIQSPEVLMTIHDWGWENMCYFFHGVENPLSKPRYRWGKLFKGFFEKRFHEALKDVHVILVASDDQAIEKLVSTLPREISRERIRKFPNRVDTNLFKPKSKEEALKSINTVLDGPIIVNLGRINRFKGWDFILDSFCIFLKTYPNATLVYVGDGEDRGRLEKSIDKLRITSRVRVTGFIPPGKVVDYLNASDLVVFGSKHEGWPISMVEALACGKAIVSTDVSGAHDMIMEGQNGFIVQTRSARDFAEAMRFAMNLNNAMSVSLSVSQKYALSEMAKDLEEVWPPLRRGKSTLSP